MRVAVDYDRLRFCVSGNFFFPQGERTKYPADCYALVEITRFRDWRNTFMSITTHYNAHSELRPPDFKASFEVPWEDVTGGSYSPAQIGWELFGLTKIKTTG